MGVGKRFFCRREKSLCAILNAYAGEGSFVERFC